MKKVPFYSQIVNWNNENSGFPNNEEIEKWQNRCCGIACLRMILDYYDWGNQKKLSYWELLNFGLDYNAHCEKGWIHQGLLNMGRFFGIEGQCYQKMNIEDVINAIDRESLCIVSVTRAFLGGKNIEDVINAINKGSLCITSETKTFLDKKNNGFGNKFPRGGHLVVAYDVVRENGKVTQIICNHPSSYPEWNKEGWTVEIEKWRDSFSGNFIEFYSKSAPKK
jgi:Peptidase_C39 like family